VVRALVDLHGYQAHVSKAKNQARLVVRYRQLSKVEAMIYGLEADAIGERVTPIEAVAIIKALDENGDPVTFLRITSGLGMLECFGMLAIAAKTQERQILEGWEDDGQ